MIVSSRPHEIWLKTGKGKKRMVGMGSNPMKSLRLKDTVDY